MMPSPRIAPNTDQSLMLIASPKNSMKTRSWTRKLKISTNRTLKIKERQSKLTQIVQLWPMNLWEITWAPKLIDRSARFNLIRMIQLTSGKMIRLWVLLVKAWRMDTRCRSRNWPRCPQTSKTAYYLQTDPSSAKITSKRVEIQKMKWQELGPPTQTTRRNTSKKVEEWDQDRTLLLDRFSLQQLMLGKQHEEPGIDTEMLWKFHRIKHNARRSWLKTNKTNWTGRCTFKITKTQHCLEEMDWFAEETLDLSRY